MSRLIDADDFIRILREIQTDAENFDNEQRRNDMGSIMALLDKQPTAFDTEQVIHNLECEKTIWVGKKITTTEVMKIDDAIDIVKKGGVE